MLNIDMDMRKTGAMDEHYGVQYELAAALADGLKARLHLQPPDDGQWGAVVGEGKESFCQIPTTIETYILFRNFL